MKIKSLIVLSCLSMLFLFGQSISLAQDTPQAVREAAIAAVNRLGIAGRPSGWQHNIIYNVAGSNLDCSLAPNTPLANPITVYIVKLTYDTEVYTIHVSEDTSIVVPCDNKLTSGVTPSAPITSATCPADFAGYLPPRLSVGATGRVESSSGFNNIIRQNYGKSSQPTGVEMPPNSTFTVIGGPECTGAAQGDPIVWWQVSYNGVIGWTAESQGVNYYLDLQTLGTNGQELTLPNLPQIPLRETSGPMNASNLTNIQLLGSGLFTNPPALVTNIDSSSTGTLAVALAPVSGQLGGIGFYDSLLGNVLNAYWLYTIPDPTTRTIGFSPDGSTFAIAERTELVFYRPFDGARMGAAPYTGFLSGAVYSPSSSRVAYWVEQGLVDGTPYRASLRMFDGTNQTNVEYVNSDISIVGAVFNSTSDRLVILFADGTIQVLNLTSGVFERNFKVTLTGNTLASMDYSFDGSLLAISSNNTVQVIDMATGTQKYVLNPYATSTGAQILAIDFAQTSNILAVSGGIFPQETNPILPVTIFDMATGALIKQIQPTALTRYLEFGGSDSYLLVAGDSSISIWGLPR